MPEAETRHARYCPHPWHGISPGDRVPDFIRAFVEITRFDSIKYEIDPVSGYLRVDRPQANSSLPPMIYGFVPQTLCGRQAALAVGKTSEGDGDALDVCILSEHNINRAEVLLDARVVGALRTLDNGKADPKLVAVLEHDLEWGDREGLEDLHQGMLKRIEHYFRNYKGATGGENPVEVIDWVERSKAREILRASLEDYQAAYGEKNDQERIL